MKIRALIVDDEASARSEMRSLLEKFPDVEILGEAGNAEEGLKLIRNIPYDVAFIDINMPVIDGLEMVRRIKDLDRQPAVVFVTAYNQFAVRAFELEATDYLVKPVSGERLKDTVLRVGRKLGSNDRYETRPWAGGRELLDRIPVTWQSKTVLLCPGEIFFIESRGEQTEINSEKGKFISSLRLKDFEARLSHRSFFRSHRSFIVNLDHVNEMISQYGGLYVLKIKDQYESEVPVSRRQTKYLKSLIGL